MSGELIDSQDVVAGGWAQGDGHAPVPPATRSLKTSEATAQRIVHDIVAQNLAPGAKLPLEAAMLDQYHVSRASLREALRLLEVQGLLALKRGPGGGPTVGRVDARNLARMSALYLHLGGMTYRELLATQVNLEPMCAEDAARNPDTDGKRAAFEPFLVSGTDLDGTEYRAHAVEFHELVFSFTRNRVLTLLTKTVAHIVASHVVAGMEPVALHRRIVAEHRGLAAAIVEGDTAHAHRLMHNHFQSLFDFYCQNWPARVDALVEWR